VADRPVVLGRVTGLFGVEGWVKVHSYTRPPESILEFSSWLIGRRGRWQAFNVTEARPQGQTLVAHLAGERGPLPDRDVAVVLLDCEIAVARAAMPVLPTGQYYWFDLVGLEVVNPDGVVLGKVHDMMETGANDVLVVAGERERLIPFVLDEIIQAVDIDGGRIVADWDPDF
jgi:16S rRNA processing protein RimM